MIEPVEVYAAVTLAGLEPIARKIAARCDDYHVWLFYGDMGSGKTTLIKEVCKALQTTDVMSSPTFSIVNEYRTAENGKVFHFDFYRIKKEAEAFDIGTAEYFYSGHPCFVEWPEKIPALLPDRYGKVVLTLQTITERTIAISLHDGEEKNGL